jgi:hypothetical protein
MATLTISSTYTVSPDPVVVPQDGKLDIVVPTGGCVICLQSDLGGKGKYDLTEDKTIDLKGHPNSTIGYDVFAPGKKDCPDRAKRNAHSIQIGSGMPS